MMALPSFHADTYIDAWRLIGNALPGTFAVRAIGVWLQVRHGTPRVLGQILLRLVAATQADFAARTPAGLVCSNGPAAGTTKTPRPRLPDSWGNTMHPLPLSHWAAALGGLYPAAEANWIVQCVARICGFAHSLPPPAARLLWNTRRILSNCLQQALEPERYRQAPRRKLRRLHMDHDPMPGRRIGKHHTLGQDNS